MRILVAGWFSFEEMGATAGDLLTRDLVCEWLGRAAIDYDLALAPPFQRGGHWRSFDPASYSHVVFVCGPFGNGWPIPEFLEHFGRCRLIGLNLSMLESIDTWNPFDLLWERDSSDGARPDMTFLSRQAVVPVVGVILADQQKEYQEKGLHQVANDAINRLIKSKEMSVVHIDTRLDQNRSGLRTPREVESLIARLDMVLTTRLHGTVLALKNGVPALAIDPIAGGAKLYRQATLIDWPVIFTADSLSHLALTSALEYCLSKAGRARARSCRDRAVQQLDRIEEEFISALKNGAKSAPN